MNTELSLYLLLNEPIVTNTVKIMKEQDCESNPVLFEKKDKEYTMRTKLNEFTKGTIDLLLLNVEEKITKTNNKYLVMTLTDGDKQVCANQWNTDISAAPKVGEVLSCELEVGTFNEKPNYTVKSTKPNPNISKSEFIATAPIPALQMYDEIIDVIRDFKNTDIARITGTILINHKEKLLCWSAAKNVHHNILAGLLYHMYRMMKSALALAEIYPVNKDLLVAGVLLHDIGKIVELATDDLGNANYTVDGNLYGHLYIGAEMIHDYGKHLGTNPEIVRNLKHIILSHHGKPEWDAVKVPCTMEAALVSELDMIDAKMYQFEKWNNETEAGTVNAQKAFPLDGAHVYHHTLI